VNGTVGKGKAKAKAGLMISEDRVGESVNKLVNGEYVGELNEEGLRHGRGELRWSDGSYFNGGFKNGQRDGYGRYVTEKGRHEYIGEWRRGRRFGHGILRHANLDRYEGGWENDKMHGHGTLETRTTTFVGNWANGHKVKGKQTWRRTGDTYEGDFSETNRMQGRGKYICAKDASIFNGEWLDGLRSGLGTETKSDGSQYEGEWLDNKPHGLGIVRFPNGRWREAEFEKGKRIRWLSGERTR